MERVKSEDPSIAVKSSFRVGCMTRVTAFDVRLISNR
jgi:hypothetical protein